MWRDDALLLDMLLGARKVREFCRDVSFEAFIADDLRQNATLHVLQLIGEAASKVSKEFCTAHSEIAWAGMIGLRHRLVHDYGRKNIPTEELRDFVADDEHAPKTRHYPLDPSLDPQLVWKGKDEQDRADLAVPVVPIYIQEKIHPQAIIDALPRIEQHGDYQLNLFADFNGGPADFAQKVDFYHHEQNWSNRMILGDSLLVMTSLAEKEGLKGKVQTITIDPPYGIKVGSNRQVSTRKPQVKDGKAEDVTRRLPYDPRDTLEVLSVE